MQSIADIRNLLAERGLRPKKALGQNFLHDQNQIRKLINAALLTPNEVVLEVGPGTGALTEALLEASAELIVCEIDDDLAALISDRFGDRLTLVHGDCLSTGRTVNPAILDALRGRPFKLIANLPYGAASPLMSALVIDHAEQCRGQWVTIQKEVADRLLAQPGTKTYGPLGVIVQSFAQVHRIGVIPPASFWPPPQVTSAMVAILPRNEAEDALPPADRRAFARFITDLFAKRRKQLGTIFGRDREFPREIDPQVRPEALAIAQLLALWKWQQ